MIENGDLVCEYCGKSHLEVGHRLLKDCHLDNKNPNLATINHKVPRILNLIDPLDENNWAVACKKCNREKGIKSVEKFQEDRLKRKKDKKKRHKKKKRQLCVA